MLLSVPLQAQKRPIIDALYLKNGSTLRGEVLIYEKNGRVEIRQSDGHIFLLQDSMLDKIILGASSVQLRMIEQNIARRLARPRPEGIYLHPEVFVGFGADMTGTPRMNAGVALIAGKQFTPKWNAAIGFGFDTYSIVERILPLFVEGQKNFQIRNRPTSIYIGLQAGYGFALKNLSKDITKARGGLMVHPYFGLRKARVSGRNTHWSLGYRFQDFHLERFLSEDYHEKFDIFYKRLTIRYGITFWLKKD